MSLEEGAGESVQPTPSLATFLATVVIVTGSGALMPGPLFAANLLQGTKGGARSGFMMSVGHMIVEFPIVLLIGFGISTLLRFPDFAALVGLVGGAALIVFGALQIRGVTGSSFGVEPVESTELQRRALVLGVGLTGLNPFFIVWWLTVGLGLVAQAVEIAALYGVVIMYVAHVWIDYAWLTGTAYLSGRGKTLLKTRGYKSLLIALALLLIYFGAGFIARILFQVNILP